MIGCGVSVTGVAARRHVTGAAFTAPTAPIFYDFTPGSGAGTEGWGTGTAISLHGLNGFTTLIDSGGGAATSALKVNTTTGYVYGSSGSTSAHAAVNAGSVNSYFRTGIVQGTQRFELHRSMVGGTDSFSGLRGGGASTSAWNFQAFANGTGGTTITAAGHLVFNGDVLEWETVGGTKMIPRVNGKQISSTTVLPVTGLDLTALGITPTGLYGFNGLAPTNGISDDIEFGYAGGTDRMTLYQPTHTAQIEADGTFKFFIDDSYTGSDPAPANVKYTITTSAKVAVAGQTAQLVQSPTIGGGTITGWTIPFTPAANTAYILTVYRDDAAGGKIIQTRGPWVYPADVTAVYGQSNATNMYSAATTTQTYPLTTLNASTYDAVNSTGSKPDSDMGVATSATSTLNNTAMTAIAGTATALYGTAAAGVVMGGIGSTSIETRGPASTYWASFLNGLRMAGRNVRYVWWIDGESNYSSTGTYASTFVQLMDSADAFNKRAIVYLMKPVGSFATEPSPSNNFEAIRRIQAKLANDYPTRVKIGAWGLDMQHLFAGTVSDLHFSNDSYAIMNRRMKITQAYYDGKSTYNLLGPKIFSAAKTSTTVLTLVVDLNTLTGLHYVNTAYGAGGVEYHGGLRFASSAANLQAYATCIPLAGPISIGTPSGGFVTLTITLSSAVAGTVYIGAPYGDNPHNPTGSATIDANVRTLGALLGGTITGEQDVGFQPYYNFATGNDYITAV